MDGVLERTNALHIAFERSQLLKQALGCNDLDSTLTY